MCNIYEFELNLIFPILHFVLISVKKLNKQLFFFSSVYESGIWVASGGQESIRIWRFDLLQGDEMCNDNDTELKAQFTLFDEETKGLFIFNDCKNNKFR